MYFDEIVGEKLEFAGRNDQKVWATGEKSRIGTLPTVGDAPEPDEKALLELLTHATRFLNTTMAMIPNYISSSKGGPLGQKFHRDFRSSLLYRVGS